jgi:hypothetical protein
LRAVEYLVSRGHNEQDVIYRYSLNKLERYVKAAQETQQGELLDLAVAFHNPKQLVKDMRKAQAERSGDVASRGEVDRLRQLASRRK